jgi:predicted nuclease of predicted toxin-antitoxin system
MRILADENLPEPMILRLLAAAHDVARMRDRKPGTPDHVVLRIACAERRVLVTRDRDFGELVVRDGAASAGVVVLRYRRDEAQAMIEALLRLLAVHGDRLMDMMVVLRPDRARLHVLRRPGDAEQ